MKTVGTKQKLPTQVLTGSKSHRHSAFQLRSTTTNCTTRGVLKAGEAQIGRDEAASCATKDSGSLFAPLPPIMAPLVGDGQDGARGSKQVSCRQLQLFQSESLDSKYFQSIGRERSNRWHWMFRKAECQVKAKASKPETNRVPLHRDYNR